MRQLTSSEVELVSGGEGISGYEGAGAILAVAGFGIAIATAPISAVTLGIVIGSAGGLAAAQFLADADS